MKKLYPILIEPGDSKTAFGIEVPDLPGCFSAADSYDDILKNTREAIALHLESLDHVPEPSTLAKAFSLDKKGKLKVAFVEVDIESPTKRINVTLPEDLIDRVDAVASNRSAYIADALKIKLAAG